MICSNCAHINLAAEHVTCHPVKAKIIMLNGTFAKCIACKSYGTAQIIKQGHWLHLITSATLPAIKYDYRGMHIAMVPFYINFTRLKCN